MSSYWLYDEYKRRIEWICQMNDTVGFLCCMNELCLKYINIEDIGLDNGTLKVCNNLLKYYKDKGWKPSDPNLFADWREPMVIDKSVGDKLAKWLKEN